MTNRPIALLTDFGLRDHYVGSLKGVILDINPQAVIFDITHEIEPQNIRQAALVLASVYPVLPEETIVVAVVDPGVGSMRQAVGAKTKRGFLLGPDNGILSLVLRDEKNVEIRRITNDRYFRKPVSSTFHGRDVFAPTGAWLSRKNIFPSLGPVIEHIHTLAIPRPKYRADRVKGEIIYFDHFGNAITNISTKNLKKAEDSEGIHLSVKGKGVDLKPFFSAGARRELIAVWNSSEQLELAVREDSAKKCFGLKLGDAVEVIARRHTKPGRSNLKATSS